MTDLVKGTRTKRNVLNKAQRAALTDTLAADILRVYKGLGGAKWLLEWAKANPTEFMKQGLARLLPPMPKEDADIQLNQQFNIDGGDPIQQARLVAFALAKGAAALGQDQVAEREPYSRIAPADPVGESLYPAELDPSREAWIASASLSPEERLNAESLDEHTNRRAFADQPAPAIQRKERTPVRLRNGRNKGDLL